jgi:pyrroloquinoline quinone biosynthesis protein D|tara:strand:- start:952 stop:1239 length:288 start_codon:yes stop_codon:yes gene_type:complete
VAERIVLDDASKPKLPRHAKLRFDKARDKWVILAPERVFELDEIAHAVISLCDGETTLVGVIDKLAEKFEAPREVIARDVANMLQRLADRGFVVA